MVCRERLVTQRVGESRKQNLSSLSKKDEKSPRAKSELPDHWLTHHSDKSCKRAGQSCTKTPKIKTVEFKLSSNASAQTCRTARHFETNASSQPLDEYLDVFPPSVKDAIGARKASFAQNVEIIFQVYKTSLLCCLRNRSETGEREKESVIPLQ